MKKPLLTGLVLVIFCLCTACSAKAPSYKQVESAGYDEAAVESSSKSAGDFETVPLGRKLIKTGYAEFQTADLKKERAHIDALIKKYGAYISSENEQAYGRRLTQELFIRIPQEKFDLFLTEMLSGIKRLDSKSVNIEDVTEEFIDITARLNVKKATEARYVQLLSQAKTVKDILDIENQIQALRAEIEAAEGRLKYLENSVKYGTLNVRIYEEDAAAVLTAPSFWEKIRAALKGGIKMTERIFIDLLYIWPLIILLAAAVFFFRWKRRAK